MKRLLVIVSCFLCLISNAQYAIDRVYIGNGNFDTLYSKQSTDSLFRNITGNYVFAFRAKFKFFIPSDNITGGVPGSGDMMGANNLSELTNTSTARTNLGIVPNTTTAGVAASPTASGTVTITHGLGRVPATIRIKSISSFTSNAAATPTPFSEGTFNSSGNRCLYMVINGTTTQVSQTSTVFSIIMVTSAGNNITGVIGNLTSSSFDIIFTEVGTHTAGSYLWECQ